MFKISDLLNKPKKDEEVNKVTQTNTEDSASSPKKYATGTKKDTVA